MIVRDLNIARLAVVPFETDTPLIVDPNAVLSLPIPAEFLESVRGWYAKVVQVFRTVEDYELPISNNLNISRKTFRKLLPPEPGRLLVLERLDHTE